MVSSFSSISPIHELFLPLTGCWAEIDFTTEIELPDARAKQHGIPALPEFLL